ncbi:MAG: STAS domain-containing protein [Acidobacteriaceae bacterium]
MHLTLESHFVDRVHIIRCSGAITLGPEAKALEEAFNQRSLAYTQLVLTLTDIHRLDSIGLGLLVRYMTTFRKRGGDLRIAAPSHFVSTLLDLTMISTVLQTFPTEQDAVASYRTQTSTHKPRENHGPRILLVDPSTDLCAFVRTVLSQHSFDVKSSSMVQDAKVILRTSEIDVLLLGPTSNDIVAQTLTAIAPKANTLRLPPDFNTHNAHEAADILLQLFGLP